MNELKNSHSPYLRQHAGNPVHWKMWGNEAFEQAKKQNKPVIVSIGYATCHWCHVMERESFEDESIARFMNDHFICIKVDREELPHVDRFYMDALQSMQQSGGWPLNMFVTPDKEPFYGGTYFPPENVYNRLSWRQVLESISTFWREKKDEVLFQGRNITEHLSHIQSAAASGSQGVAELPAIDWEWHKTVYFEHYDMDYGGWYNAPKFPQFLLVNNLILNYAQTRDSDVLQAIRIFWENLIAGGLYDSVEGGLFRYAVDNRWRVPHFEKMLYDNALMIESLVLTISYTDLSFLKPVLRQQINFLNTRFLSPNGLYYTAFDADSEGVEGLYYLLTKSEWQDFMANDFPLDFYNSETIYHQGKAHYKVNLELVKYDVDNAVITSIRQYLMSIRTQHREHPLIDTKEILSLNALLNQAMVSASLVLHDQGLLRLASEHFEKMNHHFCQEGRYTRINYIEYVIPAQSDDVVFLLSSTVSLGLATGREDYWDQAKNMLDDIEKKFSSRTHEFLSQTEIEEDDLPVLQFEKNDNIIPSSNSVYAHAVKTLGLYFSNLSLLKKAENLLSGMRSSLLKYPQAYSSWMYHYEYIREGSLIKVHAPENIDLIEKTGQKYGILNRILMKKQALTKGGDEGKIIVEQCFEDRCTIVFEGHYAEFEKYC